MYHSDSDMEVCPERTFHDSKIVSRTSGSRVVEVEIEEAQIDAHAHLVCPDNPTTVVVAGQKDKNCALYSDKIR